MDSLPCFQHTKKEKRNAKKNYKMLKIKAWKALAKKNQNIKQTMKKDFKICQKQHKKNKKYLKRQNCVIIVVDSLFVMLQLEGLLIVRERVLQRSRLIYRDCKYQ